MAQAKGVQVSMAIKNWVHFVMPRRQEMKVVGAFTQSEAFRELS
jgi:hypothetical protein